MLRLIGVCRPTCCERLSCWLCRGTTVWDVSVCIPACGELFKLCLLFYQCTASAHSHCAAVWKTEKTMSGGGLLGRKLDFPWRDQGSRLICDQERFVFKMCNVRKLTYINDISWSASLSYFSRVKSLPRPNQWYISQLFVAKLYFENLTVKITYVLLPQKCKTDAKGRLNKPQV